MIKKIKQHAKSKTQWFNALVLTLGIIEINMHLMRDNLGEYYGAVFMLVAIISGVLRSVTSGAIDDK